MRRTLAVRLGVLLAIAVLVAPLRLAFAQAGSPPTGAPSAAAVARADAQFQEALKFYKAKRYAEAEPGFQAAWELNPTYDVAGNLGYVKYHLGKYREAAELFAFVLRNFPLTAKSNKRDAAQKKLDEVRKLIASVTVRVSVVHAEVLVDGKSVGVSPLSGEVFLDPGAHTIEARLGGYTPATQSIQADKGSSQTVTLTLVASAPSGGGPVSLPPPDPGLGQNGGVPPGAPNGDPPRRSLVPGIVLASVGGAALATGIGLAAAYGGKKSDADSLNASIRSAGGYCNSPSGSIASQCSQLHEATKQAQTFGRAGVGLLVGGAAVLAASGAYFLWPESKPKPAASTTVVPVATPAGGGLLVQGSF